MKFPSMYSEKIKYVSERGSRFKAEYQLRLDEEGRHEFVKTGETDLHEYIQSFRDSVDIYNILERFRNGNEEILEQVKGIYADVSELPVKLQDIMNLNIKGKELFEKLPVDVKAVYEDNYLQFLMEPGKAFNDNLNDTVNVERNVALSGDSGASSDVVKE